MLIAGLPKTFDVGYAADYIQPYSDDIRPEDVLYDVYFAEADVLLYTAFVNAVLAKHKRARLYDKYAPLKNLTDDDVQQMIKDRKTYLKRLLKTKEGFTMEGINAGFTLKVAHLRPAISPDMQVLELQRQFVAMQWE